MIDETKLADSVTNGKSKALSFAKTRIFDLIAIGVVVSMIALTLGVLGLREITLMSLIDIVLEAIPFFLATIILSLNFYTKGVYQAKSTVNFKSTMETYSKRVSALGGKQLDKLSDFCEYYNAKALLQMQTNALKKLAISIDDYNNYHTYNGKTVMPLKIMTKKQIISIYNKDIWKAIKKINKLSVKGINVNILLGSITNNDITNIGHTEVELYKINSMKYTFGYALSILLLSLIGVNDIAEWGWFGLAYAAFKLLYILCRSYMHYFDGYNDITIGYQNHVSRKIDILKQYDDWYASLESEQLEIKM